MAKFMTDKFMTDEIFSYINFYHYTINNDKNN